jgi:hypothetical protein
LSLLEYLPTLADLGALTAVMAVLAILHLLGTPLAAPVLGPANKLLVGWALAGLVLTIGGVVGVALTPLIVIVGVVGLVIGWRWRWKAGLGQVGFVLLALAPLLVIVAARQASEVDDFAHWIPNAAYLFDHGHLQSDNDPPSASFKSAYPLNTAFIMLAASQLAGRFLEASGTLLNTLLVGTLALLLIRQFRGRDAPIGLGVAALGVLAATALNPTFVPKIAITGYAEFTTGVVLAGFAAIGVELVRRASDTTAAPQDVSRAAIETGLILSLLVNVKQTNVVLAGIGIVSLLLLALVEGRVVWRRVAAVVPYLVGIPFFANAVWRSYVSTAIPVGENKIGPVSRWNLHVLDEILDNMVSVLLHKGGMTTLAVVALVAGGVGLLRRRMDDASRLSVVAALLFFGNTAFLGFIYVAHFNEDAGRTAQSFWRYSTQLGPVLLIAAAALLGRYWQRRPFALPLWAGMVALAAVVSLPVGLAKKFRFDRDPPLPYMSTVARMVDQEIPNDAKLLIVVLKDDGLQATVMRLRAWRPTRDYHVLDNDSFDVARVLSPLRPNYAWFYCASDRLRASFGLDLPASGASLALYDRGAWHLVRTWTYPLPPDAPTGHDKFHFYGCQR